MIKILSIRKPGWIPVTNNINYFVISNMVVAAQ
ncbi:hypothetical protein HDC92_004838 [Pedobacter sp. AK017]|nr:hypothetical protein [Pedobacter sp. AK017]